MSKVKQALKMSIKALEDAQSMIGDGGSSIPNYFINQINACKEALAHLAQEPVATGFVRTLEFIDKNGIETWKEEPFYTSPQPSEWVGLSDEVKQKLHKEHHLYIPTIELIESACKQLNTKVV